MGHELKKGYDRELSLKAKIIQRLRETKRFGSRPLIATEYCLGTTGVRADLVVASRDTREVAAIEIKSAADSLRRLPHQLDAYARYFDRVIVVAAHRHQPRVRQLRFPGLEIWEVEKSGALSLVRAGEVAVPLGDVTDLLTQREKARYRGLIDRGAEGARDAFFAAFDARHAQTSEQFWNEASRRVTVECLSVLSRFAVERVEEKQRLVCEAQRYASWASLEAA